MTHVSNHVDDGVGHIVLNRPAALNALTTAMIAGIHRALDEWNTSNLKAIVLRSTAPTAFCAGGDIRQIRAHTIAGEFDAGEEFFREEYRLNARLADCRTPIVSIIDGICMGGGLGLSVHGSFRVVTPKAMLAMPETAIGFFPDVGAGHFLSRLPGAVGMYLALTGSRLDARDAMYCGLATHHIDTEDVHRIGGALGSERDRPVDSTLRSLGTPVDTTAGALARHREEIDRTFGAPTLDEIRARLRQSESSWAAAALDRLDAASPQSLEVTHGVVVRGRERTLQDCLDADFDVAASMVRTADFVEGVRAGLVDKDRTPTWTTQQFEGFDPDGRSRWGHLA